MLLFLSVGELAVYIITGGGSGIGQALAWQLAAKGHRVLVCGRRADKLAETKSKYPDYIESVSGDLTDSATIEALLEQLSDQPISGLVQNAGQIEPIAPIATMSMTQFQAQLDVNLKAPIQLFQALKPQLTGARVLHLSSAAAHFSFHSWGGYCMSKAAFYMLYQMLKAEWPQCAFGSVMPGVTDTAMQAVIRGDQQMPEANRAYFATLYQQQRLIKPEVVGQFLCWLMLDVSVQQFSEKEWDIYDESHHGQWLKQGKVPVLADE